MRIGAAFILMAVGAALGAMVVVALDSSSSSAPSTTRAAAVVTTVAPPPTPAATAATSSPPSSSVPFAEREFPTPETTGPRVAYSEMTVHQGSFTTTEDGQVIEKMDIRGNLRIRHRDVVVRDSRVMMTQTYGIDVRKPDDGVCPSALIEYVEIDGRNAADNDIPIYSGTCPWTLDHAYVHNVGRASRVRRGNTVSNSYIVSDRTGDSEAHRGAIGLNGGGDITIVNNVLLCQGTGCSAALAMYGDTERVENVLIEHNLLAATAAYCAYGGSSSSKNHPEATNVRFIDNHFSTRFAPECGRSGFIAGWDGGVRGNVARGNVIHETGETVWFNTE